MCSDAAFLPAEFILETPVSELHVTIAGDCTLYARGLIDIHIDLLIDQ